jgi:hypothetical protein
MKSDPTTRGGLVRSLLLGLTIVMSGIGCAPDRPEGTLALTSVTARPVRLDARFEHGGYADEPSGVSLVLSTVSLKQLQDGDFKEAQVVDVRYMWKPTAGRTPVSRDSTNLVIRHIVLVGDQVGIYGGGGFGWPTGTPGETGFGLRITGSSVALVDSSDGFQDLLSPATILGSIGGPLDAAITVEMRDAVSQLVTNRLGRPRWIGPDGPNGPNGHLASADR